jgi:hypothetical protein
MFGLETGTICWLLIGWLFSPGLTIVVVCWWLGHPWLSLLAVLVWLVTRTEARIKVAVRAALKDLTQEGKWRRS